MANEVNARKLEILNRSLDWKILLGILLVSLFAQVPAAGAQSAAHLTVYVTGQSMTAGFNNIITISVMNNYSGYAGIYDVDISVSIPTPLAMYADNHYHYDSIVYGQKVTITFPVYAPSSAIGSSYLGTVTVTYKQLGDTSYTDETHDISLSVNAWINLTLYGIELSSSQISPGGNTTVSGNVLNTGNLAAYNANVTVESDILSPSTTSVYLGEVDPNIPRAFSVLIVFTQSVAAGNYSITLRASATDNNRPGVPLIGQGSFIIQVTKPTQSTLHVQPPGGTGLVVILLEILRNLYNAFFGSNSP